jgi:hypothetical protein
MRKLRLLLLLGLCLANSRAIGATGNEDRWITAFGRAFSLWDRNAAIEQLPFHDFSGRTYRYVATLTADARKLRVRLSNELEHHDLVIGDATLAIVGVEGSRRRLSWGGGKARGWAPPGAPLVSDPVAVDLVPGQKVIISLYFPETYIPESHASAKSNDGAWSTALGRREKVNAFFTLKGNFVDDPGAQGAGTEVNPLIAGIEVVPATNGWTSVLAIGSDADGGLDGWVSRLAAHVAARRIAVVDLSLPASGTSIGKAGENILSRLDRDLIARPNVSAVILRSGAGELAPTKPLQPQTEFASRQIVQRAHDHDIAVFAVLPASGDQSDAGDLGKFAAATFDLVLEERAIDVTGAAAPAIGQSQADPVNPAMLETALAKIADSERGGGGPGKPHERARSKR